MPRRDGTGPMGDGPLTGRQMGNCRTGSYNTPLGIGRMWRQGGGCRGGGRGRGFYNAQPAPDDKTTLERVIQFLTEQLDFYKKRRNEIDDK